LLERGQAPLPDLFYLTNQIHPLHEVRTSQ
jgi:hypothetical protein